MAVKKPLALYSGRIKELQSGDTISNGTNAGIYATMIALTSPGNGQQFYCTDYLIGMWTYSTLTSEWKYTPNLYDIAFSQTFASNGGGNFPYVIRSLSGTGASGTVLLEAGGLTRFGNVYQAQTGSTSSGLSSLVNSNGMYNSTTKIAAVWIRAQVPTLATVAEDFWCSLGNNPAGTSGVFFLYRRAVEGTTWYGRVYDGTNTNSINTSITVDNNYHDFVYTINSASNEVKFYIDATLVATSTCTTSGGNIYDKQIFNGAGILKTAGTTSRSLNIQFFHAFVYKQ